MSIISVNKILMIAKGGNSEHNVCADLYYETNILFINIYIRFSSAKGLSRGTAAS